MKPNDSDMKNCGNIKTYISLTRILFLSFVFFLILSSGFVSKTFASVTILTPSVYSVTADLQVGDMYYSDRSFTLTSIPSEFISVGEEWIMTQNDDKNNTSASFLQFSISQSSTVYVAYDSRATGLPSWLTGFTPTSLTVGVSDSGMDHFNIYEKTFSAGTVVLGGNKASGANNVYSNYIVIVKAAGSSTEICTNGIDDDSDGLVDCADPDCASDPVCSSTFLFSDNFNDGNADGWIVFDDESYPSNWQVISGQYFQQNFVAYTDTLLGTYHRGSYAYLNAGFALTDYKATVTLTPLPVAGEEEKGNDIGIMFRYQNNDNYYRISFNSDYGFARLEKKYGGQFTTLAKNARGYFDSQQLNVTIEVTGSLILVYVNGDPLFSASDSSITSGTIALYSQDNSKFDDVSIEGVGSAPSIIISKPESYSVITGNTLNVSAIATNVPSGGSVKFVLDGGPFITDSTAPYTAQFTGVSQGEHTIDAILRDGTTAEVARDTNEEIGVQGDYFIALGDSITNGTGDTYVLDNGSVDGRIYSLQGGYEAKLNDLLTSSRSYPNIIFNEGVPGDDSYDLAYTRIDSILERHPGSNKAIIRIGTNDSGGTLGRPSGLNCSGSSCLNTFKGDLSVLLGKIGPKNIVVALIPPAFNSDGTPNTARNSIIRNYNTVILKADSNPLSGYQVGPDIYGFYLDLSLTPSKNLSSLFKNTLHPGPLGHVLDAYNLHNSINSGSPFPLPLFLENLSPLAYKQSLLGVGDQYLLDRTYMLTSIPTELMGENVIWIMTKNDDKNNTSDSFLQFNISQNSTVFIGYDSRATSLPFWLADNFTATGSQIGVSEVMGHFDVYASNSPLSGAVVLGGNRASGAAGVSTNYIVIVKKN